MSKTPYPSDLTDLQYDNIEHMLPQPKTGGRPRKYDNRALLNAILYVLWSGCQWRMLPHDFPPWKSVYGYYSRWQKAGVWSGILTAFGRLSVNSKGTTPNPVPPSWTAKRSRPPSKEGHMAMMPEKKPTAASGMCWWIPGAAAGGRRVARQHSGSRRSQGAAGQGP